MGSAAQRGASSVGLRVEISERQRRFGEELRRMRLATGLSAPEAGAAVGIKGPAVSHTEAGRLSLNTERLERWMDACGCDDPGYRAALISMGRATGRGWWTGFKAHAHPSALDLAEFEATAAALDTYETLLIPGLLQIEPYARVILKTASETESRLRFRMERQKVLHGENPPTLHAVIHEAALHTRYGGAAVMRKQLHHLIEMSRLPHITIQILPSDCTQYTMTEATFIIVGAAHPLLDTVLMEHPAGSVYWGEPEAVAKYRENFAELAGLALPPLEVDESGRLPARRDSWGLIQHILYKLY
ncbi:helix-turn-helix transcriptional regulator [Kitasatospora purpeofusca]|uniref:helix-turn-helix domain-containing protein n=1 Tax=Kitasatospora purpeofusca TaxID=67352 RepID=UPI002A5AB502|nr:helix-turn-helix transcriptional regulator [Kitasatospora purpeofusca]MDY0809815.1 helix-turn-helix transcriptional regulator [Kitasatospora purpeofusca]